MNNTNRALNRTLIGLSGFLALLIGAALTAVATLPAVRAEYDNRAPVIYTEVMARIETLPLLDTGTSWYWIFALALLVVIIILLSALIFRQGHGKEPELVRENPTPDDTTIIDSGAAEQVILDALKDRPELITSQVSTYLVRKTPVLKISVTCRRGVSPREVSTTIENTLTTFDDLLGREIPALIHISGGFRARLAKTTRTQ